jgi:CheY-like chemotaxis protein
MPYDLSRLRIDLVDANPFSRRVLRSLLVAIGIPDASIREMQDAETALTSLAHFQPDIVLCDLSMPGMSGIDFIRAVRRMDDEVCPYLPIIVCTAHTDERRVLGCRDAGANEVLNKPISVTTLYQRLVAVIERPRSFVHAPVFTGPDRRRKRQPAPARRSGDEAC